MKGSTLFGFVLVFLTSGPASAALELTMDRAVELALIHNEELLKAEEDRTSAHERVKEARGALLPNLEASYGYQYYFRVPEFDLPLDLSPDSPPDGSVQRLAVRNAPGENNPGSGLSPIQSFPLLLPHEHTFAITASQVLFSSGRIMNYYRSARSGSEAADSLYARRVRELVFQIRQAYLDALLASASSEIARASLRNTERDHELVQTRFGQGLASEFDVMQHHVELNRRRIDVMTAENTEILARNGLKIQIGVPYEEDVVLTDAFNDSLPRFRFEELEARMLAFEPSLKALQHAVRANEQMLRAAKADYFPIVSAFGLVQTTGNSEDFIPRGREFDETIVTGLKVSIPIYEGGVKTARRNQAIRDVNRSRLEQRRVRKLLTLELQNSFLAYQTSQGELEVAGETVNLARKAYELAQLRYETGVGSRKELEDAELAYSQARLLRSRITRDVNLNLYRIHSLISEE